MKLKFKVQAYQSQAVDSLVDCFVGQPPSSQVNYRIDPGAALLLSGDGFRNAELASTVNLLENIQNVQRRQNLPVSTSLVSDKRTGCAINLDIEMETGTGKTYCYIKSMFELNKRYGWSKFIVVVPSIAIREGVYKSLQVTADHFLESYGKKARFFIYDSKQLHNLESFSSDAGINVMIINVQAFNARGKDQRRIYEELDDFQSRRPIDVIKKNRPILILDEPQKMEGAKTLDSFKEFDPLFIVRYSATHKTEYNKIHRLDALDAYNQKLVKRIAVRGITVRNLRGVNAYLYLERIEISSKAPPVAWVNMEIRQRSGIKRVTRKLERNDNLYELSGGLDQYKGFVVAEIDARIDTLSFTNGVELVAGDAVGNVDEAAMRRIQIRETIKAHFEKEEVLFNLGIKVLSLFFIDEVARYRQYDETGEVAGEYAKVFEEEYEAHLDTLPRVLEKATPYLQYLRGIKTSQTHNGYFSIDKRTSRLVDPKTRARSTESDDVDAYTLILKDKERLLSFEEPVRFIFSHSALREGWDNPNVFVICTLKQSDNTISRRQEVGRGLRLSVNQLGERMDDPATVHQINELTVVASESYRDFVTALQKDISESLSARPRIADEKYFTGKFLQTPEGSVEVTPMMAKEIYRYLLKNDYTDSNDQITDAYHADKEAGTRAPLPAQLEVYAESIFQLIDSVFSDAQLPTPENDRGKKKNPLNHNFQRKEFQALWKKINRKAVYTVHFETEELIEKCLEVLNNPDVFQVKQMQYVIERGEQHETTSYEQLKSGLAFKVEERSTEKYRHSAQSSVRYDLIGNLAELTQLTRHTIAKILAGMEKVIFAQFKQNPEDFIAKAGQLINEQKARKIVEYIAYNPINETHSQDIFLVDRDTYSLKNAYLAKRHIYDYVLTDSKIERDFAEALDASTEVAVYAKLPRGFFIPTPVGDYNPDWAIAFEDNQQVKHVYFVVETKGDVSSMELRPIEQTKIACAREFFAKISSKNVKYEAVANYGELIDLIT